ncbi:UNVERIFIED_ORG: D-serine dehydratase [Peribacillus simplex]
MFSSEEGKQYLKDQKLQEIMKQSTHIIWDTGGSMVPKVMMEEYLTKS